MARPGQHRARPPASDAAARDGRRPDVGSRINGCELCAEQRPRAHQAPAWRGEARTPVEISIARKRLEEMRTDLDRSIAILQGERPAPAAGLGYPQDSADAGSTLSEADRTEAILISARDQRAGVLAALTRIEENTYGRCTDCGQEIPEGRLEARADAGRCVGCQGKHARRFR